MPSVSSGKKLSQARPTTSSTSTRPTLARRESVEPPAVVPKHEERALRHVPLGGLTRGQRGLVLSRGRVDVGVGILLEADAVDPDRAVLDLDVLAADPDDTLDEGRLVALAPGWKTMMSPRE